MQLERNQRFVRKLLRLLNRKLPPRKPARLRFVESADGTEHGYFYESQRFYWLEVVLQPCSECMMESLLHEYAHLLAWKAGDRDRDQTAHDSQFWLERGRVHGAVWPEEAS